MTLPNEEPRVERIDEDAQSVPGVAPPSGSPVVSERASIVVGPGVLLTLLILSCVLAGLVIFWLLRSMHI